MNPRTSYSLLIWLPLVSGCLWPVALHTEPTARGTWTGRIVLRTLYDRDGNAHEIAALHLISGPPMTSPGVPREYGLPAGIDPVLLDREKHPLQYLLADQGRLIQVFGEMRGTAVILPGTHYVLTHSKSGQKSYGEIVGILASRSPEFVGGK